MQDIGKKRETRRSDSKPKARPQRRKNRYHRGAKLSEHRFLRVLRGFADDQTARETSDATGISEKTIQNLFDRVRERLMRAVLIHPVRFGGAGYFLFDDRKISRRGSILFDVVSGSFLFKRTLMRHAPRVGATGAPKAAFSFLLLETVVRIFCTLSHPKDNEGLYSDEIQEAYANLQLVALYIHQHKDAPDDPALFEAVKESFERIMEDFPRILEQEEFINLVQGARKHHFASEAFYNDLRRYLLEDPL